MAKYDRDRIFILHSLNNGIIALHVENVHTTVVTNATVIQVLREPGLLKRGGVIYR